MLGYSQDDLPRITVWDVVVPEQLELVQGMVARKVAGDVSRTEYELDVLARNGRRVTLEVNTRLVKRDGRLVEMYTFVAVVYFVICFFGSLLVKRLQQKIAIVR